MRSVWFCIGIISVLHAYDGKALCDKYCVTCHEPYIPMAQLKANFLDYNNTLLHLKAPTLNQLSYRLKQQIGDRYGDRELHRLEVVAFIIDYVFHPDKDKSVCLDEVLRYFPTMPSLKGKLSEEELEAIGRYLYDFKIRTAATGRLKFQGFKQALRRARKEHKLVMIEAVSPTCHFCRKMAREVLGDSEVVAAVERDFVPVKIDISTHQLPLGLTAKVTPTFIFIDAHKRIVLRVSGAWDKPNFLALLQEARTKTNTKDHQ